MKSGNSSNIIGIESVSQKGSKKAICDAIADAWIRYDRDIKIDGKDPEEAGLVTVVDLTSSSNVSAKKSPKIDLFRFTNVLFGDKMNKPLKFRQSLQIESN
jgi:hypothetical protein